MTSTTEYDRLLETVGETTMNKNKKWTRIADSKVRHIWECVCGNKAVVSPTFYAESGTPICLGSEGGTGVTECEGNDMIYVRTEILQ